MGGWIKTNDIEKVADIKRRTLQLYVHRGWIQKPKLQSYGKGKGRGSTLFWHPDTINKVKEILALKKIGCSTNEIDFILKGKNIT